MLYNNKEHKKKYKKYVFIKSYIKKLHIFYKKIIKRTYSKNYKSK